MAETSIPSANSAQNDLNIPVAAPAVAKEATVPRKPHPNQVYVLPAPVRTYPLPSFYPNNPVSLFHLVYTWIRHAVFPPPAEPSIIHEGIWSPETRSVHIVDRKTIRALWEQGFYGKGNFSRSEPNWLSREKKRRGLIQRHVAEEHTAARRKERLQMKWERARKEQEAIEKTRLEEAWVAPVGPLELLALPNSSSDRARLLQSQLDITGGLDGSFAPSTVDISEGQLPDRLDWATDAAKPVDGLRTQANGHPIRPAAQVTSSIDGPPQTAKAGIKRRKSVRFSPKVESATFQHFDPPSPGPSAVANGKPPTGSSYLDSLESPDPKPSVVLDEGATSTKPGDLEPAAEIVDKEHLQLTLEEAFFLVFGLGALSVIDPLTKSPIPAERLFPLFRQNSYFPPRSSSADLQPDDPFLINYVVYHHFRSIGWVPRSGIKFGVDWLLYNRGPVFSHAEFALVVVPSYTDPYWKTRGKKAQRKSWHWLHGINRVQSQALKTLVFVYVDVPPPVEGDIDITRVLERFKLREVVVKRWLSNRNRD